MRNFLLIIQKFHFVIIFAVLEFFSIYLVIINNNDKKIRFLNSANTFTGFIYTRQNQLNDYLNLRETNKILLKENTNFYNSFRHYYKFNVISATEIHDTICKQQYALIPALVINNSVNKKHNYLTLDKGSRQGIKPEMAVISGDGVVGIVRQVSDNFASVISLINIKAGLSAKIKKNGYFGSIVWEGDDCTIAILNEIPNHVDIAIGDSIITSGYSAIFPEGIMVGTIIDFKKNPGGNFYNITIKLSTDFQNLQYVYIVANYLREEQLKLEKTTEEE